MAANARKELVWSIKTRLLRLSAEQIFELASDIPTSPLQDPAKLDKEDEGECFDYVCSYMSSTYLLELEDEGLSQLLCLKDVIDEMIATPCYCPEHVEKEVEVTVTNTQSNVTAKTTFDVDAQNTDGATAKLTTPVLRLNNEHGAPLTSHTSDQQTVTGGCNQPTSTRHPASSPSLCTTVLTKK